tara:strand:+ start:17596 stop:18699 length:1104 start_codon:yes stop_codon:yes gene_type:complete
MKVPFFNYPQLYLSQKERMDHAISSVIEKGAYILQEELVHFENKLAEYTNSKYAIGVANGTDAIWLALLAAEIGTGDEVIVPSHTYIASPAAIKFVGAEPILAECGDDHLLDPNDIEKRITKKTKAIMPVQLNGRTCDMNKIIDIAKKNNLLIIEDSAQGLGSLYRNKMAGTFGLAGTYSFYPAKVLGCFGDGGAVVTNDTTIYSKVSEMRDHGRNDSGEHVSWGFNSRLDNLQAAILLEKFKTFEEDIKLRRDIASLYHEKLGSIEGLIMPPPPGSEDHRFDTFQNFEIRCEKRNELKIFLSDNNIGTLIQWGGKAIHQIRGLNFNCSDLPFTEKLFKNCLLIPMNSLMSLEDADYVAHMIKKFYS